ncbi:hypothetical protein [Legionella maceachernii]|uniref:Uncharacterized protein n=1 Tax=Legionella maceachernii TaxID=466 RepID=A0A0W0WBD0_9GAMM|nr:hypothetical protein [Legionella maceachernii]KTD29674.1 hypothetical protein Lmac_0849 [Legionella maceachernii]SKA21016.1 hypothetical protein SAMN02745128_02592 [Legionella maceachernii]SUP02600.1 Uncharacterised protein [Legionella maceachernii]
MSISTPIVNARQYYINGLKLGYYDGTHVVVTAGKCSNSTNENDISVGLPLNVAATQTGTEPVADGTGTVLINAAANGVAGLDTGALANNTFYAVYAIGDSYGINDGSAVISANLTQPLLPAGYDMYFRIAYVKTNGSAQFLAFRQDGCGLDRWMWYDASIPTSVTAGSSATYAPVDASAALPSPAPTMVNWACVFTPTAAGNKLVLTPGLSTSTNGYAQASGAVAAVAETVNLVCPTDGVLTQAIEYKVTGSAVAINVQAYLDQLALIIAQ